VREQWQDLAIGRADLVEVTPTSMRQAQQEHLNLLTSRPTDLLFLSLSTTGAMREQQIRQAAALADDRASLYQVVFQKQGKVTASLLPEDLSGYAFLFSPERDLANAHGLRNLSIPVAMVSESSDASMQLAGQRLALNLHDVGFNVQFNPQLNRPGADIVLRRVHLE
jgi:ABC-type oligopeptide transport system substrate-binding subunit